MTSVYLSEKFCTQLGAPFFLPKNARFKVIIDSESNPQVIQRLCEIAKTNDALQKMLQSHCLELQQEHALPGWFTVRLLDNKE